MAESKNGFFSHGKNFAVACAVLFALAMTVWSAPRYGSLTDARDGQTYKTVKIGEQIWMAQNLNYEYKVNGATYRNWCYANREDNCTKYGRLYYWASAMDSATTGYGYGKKHLDPKRVRGVCPEGWHLPDSSEWSMLITTVGGKYSAIVRLKSIEGWNDDGNGDDAYGFAAVPSGYRLNGTFVRAGDVADFWSSTESDSNSAYHWLMQSYGRIVVDVAESESKHFGVAVRCVKD